MKILYISPPLYGFWECLFEGATEINGLPSFNKPLRKLIESGHQVDIVLLHNTKNLPNFNIKASWLKREMIKECLYYENKMILRPMNIINNRRIIKRLMNDEHYDFVYGHGSATEIFRSTAHKSGIPFGQRLYGTFLWNSIEKNGLFKTKIKHYIEYNSFKTEKSFLLVTNDGSRGDLTFNAINKGNHPFDFQYWINGVNIPYSITNGELIDFKRKLVSKPFLFYVARFDEWKRQERAVRILKKLIDRGHNIHLYLAGPSEKGNTWYFEYVMDLVEELGLNRNVTYMGHIDAKTIYMMCKLSIASLSLYDVCNLTNVFHEMLAAGSVVIVKNDGVVNDFIKQDENGFVVNYEEEVVDIVEKLLLNPEISKSIRQRAIETSKTKMLNWDQRIDLEIQLITKYAKNKKDSKYDK
ncbi:hypothetical protein AOC36_08645 [Erysipelothrix larvae]|uniref:Glycosyl transferase family 1 domain-containing protein n=1 Tax=Erysipelothrix larvae TaxID=1514105 RepID=A0A120JTV3_9FIRM|nr:glycosyltransferase family 4 protein [Erysipelothrix larvae]AMC94053.1 hypothetical protein AOC36_08645 [Erysipelothrix larvae]